MALHTTEGTEAGAHPVPVPGGPEFALAGERDLPIFATHSDRRARLVLGIGGGLTALTVLWLAALLAGAFGLRGLSVVPLPEVGGDGAPAAGSALQTDNSSRSNPGPNLRNANGRAVRHVAGARFRGSAEPGLSARRGRRFSPATSRPRGGRFDGLTPRSAVPQQGPAQQTAPSSSPAAPIPAQRPQEAAPAAPPRTVPSGTRPGGTAPATTSHPTYTPSGKAIPAGQNGPSPAGPPSALPDRSQAVDRGAGAREPPQRGRWAGAGS
jgi:hypothetical protein